MTVILKGKMVRFSERVISGRSIKNVSIAQSDAMGIDVTKITLYGDDVVKDLHLGTQVEFSLEMNSYDGVSYRVSNVSFIDSTSDFDNSAYDM